MTKFFTNTDNMVEFTLKLAAKGKGFSVAGHRNGATVSY